MKDHRLILYHGEIILSDFYKDIDRGFDYFVQAGFSHDFSTSTKTAFMMHVSPRYYFHLPIVEVMNYYIAKRFQKSLSVMALTALHETISNSLLWGLLKVTRPQEIFEFHDDIQKYIGMCEKQHKTMTLVIQDDDALKVRIINPYDENFSMDAIQSSPSPHVRGGELIQLFSHMSYDEPSKAIELTFGEVDNVYQTIAQS